MPEEVAILIFTALVGTFSIFGLKILVSARKGRGGVIDKEEVQRLAETVEGLQDQMFQVRDAVSELHERVDFAERLLTRGEKRGDAG
jgi:hypothetical protein